MIKDLNKYIRLRNSTFSFFNIFGDETFILKLLDFKINHSIETNLIVIIPVILFKERSLPWNCRFIMSTQIDTNYLLIYLSTKKIPEKR